MPRPSRNPFGRRNPHTDSKMTRRQHLETARAARIRAFFDKYDMMPQKDMQRYTAADHRDALGVPR